MTVASALSNVAPCRLVAQYVIGARGRRNLRNRDEDDSAATEHSLNSNPAFLVPSPELDPRRNGDIVCRPLAEDRIEAIAHGGEEHQQTRFGQFEPARPVGLVGREDPGHVDDQLLLGILRAAANQMFPACSDDGGAASQRM